MNRAQRVTLNGKKVWMTRLTLGGHFVYRDYYAPHAPRISAWHITLRQIRIPTRLATGAELGYQYGRDAWFITGVFAHDGKPFRPLWLANSGPPIRPQKWFYRENTLFQKAVRKMAKERGVKLYYSNWRMNQVRQERKSDSIWAE